MGVTCSREASVSFDHLAHLKKRRDPDTSEPPNYLDEQLNTTDPYRQVEIIRRLAEAEVEMCTAKLREYGLAIARENSLRNRVKYGWSAGTDNRENLDVGKINVAVRNFLAVCLTNLKFPLEEREEIEGIQPASGMKELLQPEIDGQGLSTAWSLQLAKLTLECTKTARTIDEAITNYKNSNSNRSHLQKSAIESLSWKPDSKSIEIWLRDSIP